MEDIRRNNPFSLLDQLVNDFNKKYLDSIQSFLITTPNGEGDQNTKLYSFYLIFLRQDKFTYKLFDASTENNDGKYPVVVTAFSAQIKEYGRAQTQDEFEKIKNTKFN